MLVKQVVESRAQYAVWVWRLATREGRGAGKGREVDEETYREVRTQPHHGMLSLKRF